MDPVVGTVICIKEATGFEYEFAATSYPGIFRSESVRGHWACKSRTFSPKQQVTFISLDLLLDDRKAPIPRQVVLEWIDSTKIFILKCENIDNTTVQGEIISITAP